jgi:thiol-disulfide isomerase/thioredoxin
MKLPPQPARFSLLTLGLGALLTPTASAQGPRLGPWHGALAGPGGEIALDFELSADAAGEFAARLSNHGEWIPFTSAARDGARLVLTLGHYDAELSGELIAEGGAWSGTWRKRSGRESWAELPFRAVAGPRTAAPAPSAPLAPLSARYAVQFSSSPDPAVLVLEHDALGALRGTFLTTSGDFRYLGGSASAEELVLTTFDGAHAFRFQARVLEDGARLEGDFWSRESWHETWSARRDPQASLPDPFQQSLWRDEVALADLVFPDLAGRPRSLAEASAGARAVILQVFGSWCPNCNDESAYLVELDQRFRDQGLWIGGLAFELSGDRERDARQVEAFARRHEIEYELFLAGTSDKAAATEALAALDRVRAYPTTVFLTGDGRVRAVHTGFAGPATGPAHEALRAEFERLIQELLAGDFDAATQSTWASLTAGVFFDHQAFGGAEVRFLERDGARFALRQAEQGSPVELSARVLGEAVWIGAELWRFEPRTGLLSRPDDAGARLAPRASAAPDEVQLQAALASPDPHARRAALWSLADLRGAQGGGLAEALPLLADPDRRVRLVAAWAQGVGGAVGDAAALVERLPSPDAALRRECARALGRLARRGDPAQAEPLLAALNALQGDPDPLVQSALAEARAR